MGVITQVDERILQIEKNQRLLISRYAKVDELVEEVARLSDLVATLDGYMQSEVVGIRDQLDSVHSELDAISAVEPQ